MESNLVRIFCLLVCFMKCAHEVHCQIKHVLISDNGSIDNIANGIPEQTTVKIDIESPKVHLNKLISFANLASLAISGTLGSANIVCTTIGKGAGIVVNDTSMVVLTNVSLVSCGSLIQHKSNTYLSALTLLYCSDVTVTGVVIEKSNGIGMMIESHQGDTVNIRSSDFRENKLQHNTTNVLKPGKLLYGGGGVHVFVQRSVPSNKQTTVMFDGCTFVDNMANDSYPDENSVHRGRGGGAYVLLKSGLKDVYVTVTKCMFIANNAFHGGGLAVQVISETNKAVTNVQAEILQSVFENNGCLNGTHTPSMPGAVGGGIHLTFDAHLEDSIISNSSYKIQDVNVTANCAEIGGGLYHFSGLYDQTPNSMRLDNCLFEKNVAHLGSAIMMAPSSSRNLRTGNTIFIIVQNSMFVDNHVFHKSQMQETPGVGTIYVSTYDIYFLEYNHFENNWGSALHVINGILHFEKSNASFEKNIGLQGGAIALIGSSAMIVGPQRYQFTNNQALYQGGAIYVQLIDKYDLNVRSRNCFLQCVDDDEKYLSNSCKASIVFAGNNATHTTNGHAIYTTSLRPCQVHNNKGKNKHFSPNTDNWTQKYRTLDFTFLNGQFQDQVATDGSDFKINKSKVIIAVSGEKFSHGVNVTNELNRMINATFWATVTPSEKHTANSSVKIDSSFSTLITDKIQVRGSPNQTAILTLNMASSSQSYIRLNMKLINCPPGFRFDINSSECVCNADAYTGIYKCDMNTYQSHLIPGYWAGYFNSQLVTSACLFCDSNKEKIIILPQQKDELDEILCGDTREGVVCGKCRENFTVHFHSPGYMCKPAEPLGCRLGWLFYIISEILPLTIMFITVLTLNIRFTSGAINGFILSVQLFSSLDLSAGGIITVPTSNGDFLDIAIQGYQVIYGFFNLDFFNSEHFSFCLWKHVTALDMIAFKFVTILYTMLLIVTIVWIMNKCSGKWFGRCCRINAVKSSIIHGISAFLMIGYAQCINVSLRLLLQVHIYAAKGTKQHTFNRVWFNGEVEYLATDHLPYALPAILCLSTIGVLPPALLLTYPLVNKIITYFGLEEKRFFSFVSTVTSMNTLKPLLDSFQGCFKDNFRFFAGIYFLYRWMILVIHVVTIGFLSYYITVGGFLVIILTIHTICQPYIKRLHNVVDALFLCNLALINLISLFNFHYSNNPVLPNRQILHTIIAQTVLIYLPAIAVTLYVIIVIVKYCKDQLGSMNSGTCYWRNLLLKKSTNSPRDSVSDSFIHERLIDETSDFESSRM